MKVSYKTLLLFFIFYSQVTFAQQDSFVFLGNNFDDTWTPNSFVLSANGSIASNSINATMLTDYLVRSSFTPEAKEAFLARNDKYANLLSQSGFNFEYKLNNDWGIYLKGQTQLALRSEHNFTKMVLFGNAQFAGKEVSSANFSYINQQHVGIGATHRLLDEESWKIKLNFGFNSILNLNQIDANKLSVFTEQSGEYLDIEANNVVYGEISDNQLDGVGLDLGIDIRFVECQNEFGMSLSQISPVYLFDRSYVNIDTSFRFEGFELDPLNNDSFTLVEDIDSTYTGIINRGRQDRKVSMLPSNLSLYWMHSFNQKHGLEARLSTIDLGNYGVQLDLSHHLTFTSGLRLRSTISAGDFIGIQWSEAIEYCTSSWNIYADIRGLNAIILPEEFTAYGARLGIAKRL